MKVISALLLSAIVAAACGGAAQPAPTSPAAATSTPTPEVSATAQTSDSEEGITFAVSSGTATVRVREQLADLQAPSDAVLETSEVSGSFTLKTDGSFTTDSKIEIDIDSLESDSGIRDGFIKRTTLNTSQFPTATFVPTTADGLAMPLADGAFTFTLVGNMTIKGVTKEVEWNVTGQKSGGTITVTATNAPAWTFADFGMDVPRAISVLSIVDEIRLEVALEATSS